MASFLQQFNLLWQYVPGSKLIQADALSRRHDHIGDDTENDEEYYVLIPPEKVISVTVSVTSFICLCYAASLIRSYLLFISTFDALTLYTAICPIYRCTSFISMFHSYLSPQTLTYHCCSATDRCSTYCAYTA